VFHELVGQMLDWRRRGDVIYVPEMRAQPVAARTVAEALANLATAPDRAVDGPFPEIAGPREERLVDLARLLVARRGEHVKIELVDDPNDPDSELNRSGGLLPGRHATLAGPTFAEWLDATSVTVDRVAWRRVVWRGAGRTSG
jgi:hypothetical protein